MSTPSVPVDQIKAGDYEIAPNTSWRQTTSKPGEPYDFVDHGPGDIVKLDVAEARRLFMAGAVVKPGEAERNAAEAARAAAEAAQAAYERALLKAQPAPEPSKAPK